jgi:hypothetical protein
MKRGDIVCIKTTGELVMVIKDATRMADYHPQSNFLAVEQEDMLTVRVRRPVETENGITHVDNTFYTFELESPQDHLNRKAEAYMMNLNMQKSVIYKKIKELEKEVQQDNTFDASQFKVN